jgi:hypothetical protein
MKQAYSKAKVEYGDFQTPLELANKICRKLLELGVNPKIIVEPTCGIGNFIEASANYFKLANKIIGIEINYSYLQEIRRSDKRIQIQQADFFEVDWFSLIDNFDEQLLVIGNFPWVTNSQQGVIGGVNLPQKTNFQNYSGLEAITGQSNFDISEWMLIQTVQWLQKRDAYLAMLCKTSVARKLLSYMHSRNLNLAHCSTYKIDTKKYFDANVDACLLLCKFDSDSRNYFGDVFSSLEAAHYYQVGYRNNILIRDIKSFDKLADLYNPKLGVKWRSGIKHDCSSVMELRKIDNSFVNGLGEVVALEETCLFPLLKGSDVAQNRTEKVERYLLVTQRFIGESTEYIRDLAPQTWKYLEEHSEYLDGRKSKIYQNSSRFSIFGVGFYTFAPWKIAICGLYKKLDFRLVGKIKSKEVVFDDTVYFLSFEDEQTAYQTFMVLTSPLALDFYSSLIFWDEKRPIKSSILNSLNLSALAERLAVKL